MTDAYPTFGVVDLDDRDPPDHLDYPMWLKPVKSFGPGLAFVVANRDEFTEAMNEIRAGIDVLGDPFELVLERLDLPDEVAAAGAKAVVAEEVITGNQVTLEGFCHDGTVTVYGAVDSILYPDSPSFLRYEYPSAMPEDVIDRCTEIATNVTQRVGLDNVTFNVEFFWDRAGVASGFGGLLAAAVRPHSTSGARA